MLVSDSIAALCTLFILFMTMGEQLEVWHIYLINAVLGFMNAFQSPASSVALGRIVPKEKLATVSGMNTFSSNLVILLNPVIATALYAIGGMSFLLSIDLLSFLIAFLVLLFLIRIPEEYVAKEKQTSAFKGAKEGFGFLKKEKGILVIILTMALLNFFSRLTYENILSPIILFRSGNSNLALGIVNTMMGVGGILGGIIVSTSKLAKDRIKMIYVSAALSFLFGDLLMGLGQSVFFWALAGIAASLPIAFIGAGQTVILYERIPDAMQGRVFAVRNAIQFGSIPIGILLGGWLADYVFEPFLQSNHPVAIILSKLVGEGPGSGMAVMFLCTGICGFLFCCFAYHRKELQELR